MIKFIKNNVKEIFFFGLVGLMATATHYICALTSLEELKLDIYLSHLLGYLCAVAVSFFGHSLLTFKTGLKLKLLMPFFLVSVSTFCLSELALWMCESIFKLNHKISIGIVVISIPVISYFMNKLWVYKNAGKI